ncbi:substrate-binding domain-containing protein, partial [Streptomyces sp. NPDC059456]|uniref:substrate-binding domain-containing protein n=1 Tax=Streptomyces sp. NPDC059456 TaxID=3346838 RepID=UPI0036902E96
PRARPRPRGRPRPAPRPRGGGAAPPPRAPGARPPPPARHGLRIPGQLRLVCASEDPSYAAGDPAVSTVTLRPEVIGERAVDALVALLESPRGAPPGQLTVPAALAVRTSSLAVPPAGRRGSV